MKTAIRVLIPALLLVFAAGDSLAKGKGKSKKPVKALNVKLLVGTWAGKLHIAETGKPVQKHDLEITFAKGKGMVAKLGGQSMKANYQVKGRTVFFTLNGMKMKLSSVVLTKKALRGSVQPAAKGSPVPKNMKISLRLKRKLKK